MAALTRPTKITFGELREMDVRSVLDYCADYKCTTRSRSAAPIASRCCRCKVLYWSR
jgi:hypothetical protein